MRKLFLALSISLVLSLVLGGVIVFAANNSASGDPLDAIDQGVDAALTFLQAAVTVDGMSPVSVAPVDDIPLAPNEPVISDPVADPVADDPVDVSDDVDDPEETEDTEDTKDGGFCPGDAENPHPVGESLTNKYLGEGEDFATKYGEVMTLFCGGHFGFGEIDKALGIALAAGIDPAEVIALREGGMGWGRIRKEYNLPKFPRDPWPGIGVGLGNGNAGGNGNAFGLANNPGNGNAGGNGNGNAYGHTKNKSNNGKKP